MAIPSDLFSDLIPPPPNLKVKTVSVVCVTQHCVIGQYKAEGAEIIPTKRSTCPQNTNFSNQNMRNRNHKWGCCNFCSLRAKVKSILVGLSDIGKFGVFCQYSSWFCFTSFFLEHWRFLSVQFWFITSTLYLSGHNISYGDIVLIKS